MLKINRDWYKWIIILFFLSGMLEMQLLAQSSNISLEVDVEPLLIDAQLIQVGIFSFDSGGRGERFMNMYMQNNSDSTVEGLHLNVSLSSQKAGTILNYQQEASKSFSLRSGQSFFISNNDLARQRLPGVEEELRFALEWTSSGLNFLNRLQGRRYLPSDEYTISVELFQDSRPVESSSFTFGGQMLDSEPDLLLFSPGDYVGLDFIINNLYPEFRWDGPRNVTYRVILVEEQHGENPETSIQNAKSTTASRMGGSPNLLDFEMMDVLVDEPGFQYPMSGVQPLQEEKTYYWQVFSVIETAANQEETASEIWSFRLGSSDESEGFGTDNDDELFRLLEMIVGYETARELQAGNYDLESIDQDGQEFFGEMAKENLLLLIEKVQNGEAKFLRE
ncbi:MAG: hypothetical protein WEA58_09945 [Balneolaceae bacterium]